MAKVLDNVIGTFSDGELTEKEYEKILENIKKKGDYLTSKQHKKLLTTVQEYLGVPGDEHYPLTKRQYVQIMEKRLSDTTGVTRD